ncbi:glycosyltransferase family 2 protein [Puniceibacterium sp. IMCC21224]|uniref:glycosyltransferase family 2 protein n=1 Tax=Puniceibacterium sp. IMCC21224 TaxID=1618204 RepID=UPI00064DBBE6|nr:glycosyltransferase family 2 protein [Puniceibacterium sp. IMCC21224]KMK67527.1 Glycosyl transferase family 2 [Puniceibacterium sp. IMCC21224]
MQTTAAAVTMVRNDPFFLRAWLRHYGGTLGRENCYIISHGREDEVRGTAQGANIIGIPGDTHQNFDMKRWRLLNGVAAGLRGYYDHVIVGDVDELVIVDPDSGMNLLQFLEKSPLRRVLTPLGLEVIHRLDIEPEPISDQIIGPRRYVRLAPHYSKPCILSMGTKIARGGHYTQSDKLNTPDALYLLHLKFCDFENYIKVMDQRNAVAREAGAVEDTSIGRHWFAEARGEDLALFEGFKQLQMQQGFDLKWLRKRMHKSWKPRGDTGFWQFGRPEFDHQYCLPERFIGLV